MQATPCSPNPEQSNWFNLVIDEIGEVAAYLKSTIGKNYPPNSPVLSLEFILYTADGDQLPLETWIVRIDKECQDGFVNIRTTLYQQMSTLLKSVILASRFTPTYRYYVKNQGPETFVIIYRVFEGEPDLSILGEEVKYKRLGYLPSPFGTISVELHFRTKMEIQPQPFVEEGKAATSKPQEIPIGISVPAERSQCVAVSPTSVENINLFSTSPISQDLPFRAKSPTTNFTQIGRSYSSADAMDQKRPQLSASSKSDQQASPPTSSSFPQRNSLQKIRMRNNSFPFASLLLYSQSSSDQLVKTLPNVPEDAALISNPNENAEQLAREKESPAPELRRNSSLGIEMVAYSTDEMAGNRPSSSTQNSGEQPISRRPSSSSNVLFQCSSENRGEEEKAQQQQQQREKDDVDSDDSYVKVIGFASASDEDLGKDLGEFFKEVRLAPDNLRSFGGDETTTEQLGKQLDEFRQKETSFSQFVSRLKDRNEAEEEEEE